MFIIIIIIRLPLAGRPAFKVLELLAIIMVDGEGGHRAILDAMDYFKCVKRERVRFESLVQVRTTKRELGQQQQQQQQHTLRCSFFWGAG